MAQKRITLNHIAQEAHVSRTTVSFVLNNTAGTNISRTTRLRVLETAGKLGYFRASTRQRNFVAYLMRQTPDQTALFGDILHGVSRAVELLGYHVGLFPLPVKNAAQTVDDILATAPEGIIISGPIRRKSRALHLLLQQNIPVVVLGHLENPTIYGVDIENAQSARLAVRHLLELGHRNIALITNAPLTFTTSKARLEGYRQALAEFDVPYVQSLVRYADFTSQSGYEAMLDLLQSNSTIIPSAVFVASDTVALGAMQAARQWGLEIPGDISFVGFNDIPVAEYMCPPLTTVQIRAHDLGYYAGRLLMELLHGTNAAPRRISLNSTLKVRASTGPL